MSISNSRCRSFRIFAASAVLLAGGGVHGAEPNAHPNEQVPCAVLAKFDGDVQIMDSTRTRLVDTELKAGVPCGGWVSTQKGMAELHHRQGFTLKLGEKSFVEIFDNEDKVHVTGDDHLILYRGKLFVESPRGTGELRVVTPNGRVRVQYGTGVLIFDQQSEETQIVALEGKMQFENRFENKIKIPVRPGEASSLNLSTFRVLPSTPNAVQIAEMRKLLGDFPLDVKEMQMAIRSVRVRNERKFAVQLDDGDGRAPASVFKKGPYERHPASARDPEVERRFMKKILGGGGAGSEALLFPGKKTASKKAGRMPSGSAHPRAGRDPASDLEHQHAAQVEDEKKRIMRELNETEFSATE